MPRLIDADALEKRHCENCGEIARKICKDDPVCATPMWAREEETIDPESLRPHGRWIGIEYDGYADGCPVYDLWECSNCGEEVYGEDVPEQNPYCRGCGAKMDLEE